MIVHTERSLYNDMVDNAKRVVHESQIDCLSAHKPCSSNFTMHYSFDYAQQIYYPSNPFQPGPVYFLVPRRCGIFGICCEALPKQVNYLVDEGMCTGKGANEVISYIHHFFEHYGLGEVNVHLHCDNCAGQNKNKYMLWYLAFRTIHRLHLNAEVHFMVPGHTKFAPDWCFGLLKQKYRRTNIGSLADIATVVKDSTIKGLNMPQLVGSEDGNCFVPTFDWQSFLSNMFRPLPGIRQLNHFRFEHSNPGVVFYKSRIEDIEKSMTLLNANIILVDNQTPDVVPSPGLSLYRQQYLFNNIRQFVPEGLQDIVCPKPSSCKTVECGPAAVTKKKATKIMVTKREKVTANEDQQQSQQQKTSNIAATLPEVSGSVSNLPTASTSRAGRARKTPKFLDIYQ